MNVVSVPRLWLAALGAVISISATHAEPIKIVPIGDSITQGRKGDDGKFKRTYGWRYPFWKKLIDAGIKFDLVGSIDTGFDRQKFGGDPEYADYQGQAFDKDHEGHWGWAANGIADKLPGWLEGYTPDIALIMLGTNDSGQDRRAGLDTVEETKKDMRRIIEILRADNPNVGIIIGEPFQEWDPFPAMAEAYRELAQEMTTAESPVATVATNEGWISNPDLEGTSTVDWVHPNQRGDEIIAAAFFEGLKEMLAGLGQEIIATP